MISVQAGLAFAEQKTNTNTEIDLGFLAVTAPGMVHKVAYATATIPVTITTTPPPSTSGTSGSGAAGLGTATAAVPNQVFTSSGLNTARPLNFTLSSGGQATGVVTGSGQTSPSISTSGNSGTLIINVPANTPTAPTGATVTVSFDTTTRAFTLTSPVITRPGARVTSRKPADSIVHALSASAPVPAAPVYQVSAPKILAFNSTILLDASDADGNSLSISIPVILYAAGEVSDLVAISTDQFGNLGSGFSGTPFLSRDGRVMAFTSTAGNIGVFGNVSAPQIFRYSTSFSTVDMVSQFASISGTLGGGAALSASSSPVISSDGSLLVFASDASNIYPYSVFNQPMTRQLYSISANGVIGNLTAVPNPVVSVNGVPLPYAFDRPALSQDGSRLAFDTSAPLAGTAGGLTQVYLKDLTTGGVSLVSATATGVPANGASLNASISDDGRYVLFESDATNLVSGVSNYQVYLKDMVTGILTLVSGVSGKPGNGQSLNGKLSGQVPFTGQAGYAVFESDATNLVAASANGLRQVYRVNLANGAVTLISANSAGSANGGTNPAISGDGRFVVFKSSGAITTSNAPPNAQIYVADAFLGKTLLISSDANGLVGNAASDTPTISGDGSTIGFTSLATNLDGSATNGVAQAYIAVNKLNLPLANGFWVNPNLPGQFYAVELSGNKLWIGGFSYNGDATPNWFFANPSAVTSSLFQGSLLAPSGGPTLTGDSRVPVTVNLGTVSLSVLGQTSANLVIGGTATAIQRYDFGTGGSSAGPAAFYPETGWWYAPENAESLFLEVQGNTLFAIIASYSAIGQSTWYQTLGTMSSAQTYNGTLNQCSGGLVPNCSVSLGNVKLTFNSTLAGTATLPSGKTIAIQRFRF